MIDHASRITISGIAGLAESTPGPPAYRRNMIGIGSTVCSPPNSKADPRSLPVPGAGWSLSGYPAGNEDENRLHKSNGLEYPY